MEKPKIINRRKNITREEPSGGVELDSIEISRIDMYSAASTTMQEEVIISKTKMSKLKKIRKLFTKRNSIIVLFVVLAIGFGYYFIQYKKLTKDPNAEAKAKTEAAVKAIGALAIIPNDPNTVLANVTDVTKLKGQSFFNDAQNGDEILIFPAAMRAVLYRPSVNKIVNIGPLASTPPSSTDTAGAQVDTTKIPSTKTTTTTTTKTPTKTTTTKKTP